MLRQSGNLAGRRYLNHLVSRSACLQIDPGWSRRGLAINSDWYYIASYTLKGEAGEVSAGGLSRDR